MRYPVASSSSILVGRSLASWCIRSFLPTALRCSLWLFFPENSLRQRSHAWNSPLATSLWGSDSEELSGEESVDEAETERNQMQPGSFGASFTKKNSTGVQRQFEWLLEVGAIPCYSDTQQVCNFTLNQACHFVVAGNVVFWHLIVRFCFQSVC